MQVYSYRPPSNRPVKRRKRPVARLLLGVMLVSFGIFILANRPDAQKESSSTDIQEDTAQTVQEQTPEIQPLPNVQQIVEEYVTNNPGDYSVLVTDIDVGEELAAFKVDREYFAASLYKVYVAYLGYIDVQDGKYSFDEPFLGNWSRQECLDKMIRESHSPCAEKMWVEQGKARSTERLKDFGVKNTNMERLATTAEDVNTMFVRLYQRKDLNDANVELYLESLKHNIYRDVLPAALPDLVVMDKVGFRELVEYHDGGIILLPNERPVAITILTQNAGTKRMVSLTKAIFEPLIEASR